MIGDILVEAQKIARAVEGNSVMFARQSGSRQGAEVQSEFLSARGRRDPRADGAGEERPAAASGEIRLGVA